MQLNWMIQAVFETIHGLKLQSADLPAHLNLIFILESEKKVCNYIQQLLLY